MITPSDTGETPEHRDSNTTTADGHPPPLTEDQVRDLLRGVIDPDIGVNIVDLGLVYGVTIDEGSIRIAMTLTTPACPYGPQLIQETRYIVMAQDGVENVDVDIVWEPPWSMELISEATRLEMGMDI